MSCATNVSVCGSNASRRRDRSTSTYLLGWALYSAHARLHIVYAISVCGDDEELHAITQLNGDLWAMSLQPSQLIWEADEEQYRERECIVSVRSDVSIRPIIASKIGWWSLIETRASRNILETNIYSSRWQIAHSLKESRAEFRGCLLTVTQSPL